MCFITLYRTTFQVILLLFSDFILLFLRLRKIELVLSKATLTLWVESSSLVLVGHPSNDGITIKISY